MDRDFSEFGSPSVILKENSKAPVNSCRSETRGMYIIRCPNWFNSDLRNVDIFAAIRRSKALTDSMQKKKTYWYIWTNIYLIFFFCLLYSFYLVLIIFFSPSFPQHSIPIRCTWKMCSGVRNLLNLNQILCFHLHRQQCGL